MKEDKKTKEEIEKAEPFIYMRPMRQRPMNKADCEKDTNVFHFVMTGWKG